jgi:Subtilase family
VSRPSPSRSIRRGRILLAVLALANSFAFRAGAVASEECAPFESPYPAATTLAAAAGEGGEGGVAPSGAGEARAGGAGGAIVSLPTGGAAGSAEPAAGEALLALPKRADGTLPRDFELGPGVRIAESYWSPVLCATVALLVGPPGASLAELVPRVPSGGAAAPHDVYSTAAVALRPAPPIPTPGGSVQLAAATEAGAAPPQPDPYRSLQYGLDRLGADGAWARSRGSGVRVALLDSAPEVAHRDLAGVELAAIDGGPGTAPATHGTLMAGVMRAVAGNGFGIAGVAPAAELIAVPVCTPAGASASDACRLYDVLRGIDRAFELGAAVLNLSLVGPPNPLLERAMARVETLGAVAVAAAGNEGTSEPRYPAAYASVIGVGAVDAEGAPFIRGNIGPSAEILAPGVEVLSTVPGDAFAFGEGTSLAAAHVSAALALLVGAGVEPSAARTALFQAAEAARSPTASAASPPSLPPLCGALERLARACP